MHTHIEHLELRKHAENLLSTRDLALICKEQNDLLLSQDYVLKVPVITDETTRIERVRSEHEYLHGYAPVTQPVVIESPDKAIFGLRMNRLPTECQLSTQLLGCRCLHPIDHLIGLMYRVLNTPTPALWQLTSSVRNAFDKNLQRQLDKRAFPHSILNGHHRYVELMHAILDSEEFKYEWNSINYQGYTQVDGHGNLFTGNIWLLDNLSVALDPTIFSRLPFTLRHVGLIVDSILLHSGESYSRTAIEHILKAQAFSQNLPLIYLVAFTIKFLVRIRYAILEIGKPSDVGGDRLIDAAVLRRARFLGPILCAVLRDIVESGNGRMLQT